MSKSILRKDFPKLVVTEQTIENIKKHPEFYQGAPVRVQMGRIYTNEEFAQRSDEVLSRELPGGEKKNTLKRLFRLQK